MKNIKAFTCFLIIFALTLSLYGCSKERIDFSVYITDAPSNLDPQSASSPSEITSVLHLFNALFRKTPDGKIAAEAAQDYTVSENGLIYTITLREGQFWNSYRKDDIVITPELTADDYIFGLQRVFMRETKSPHALGLSAIKNSREVLNGTLDVSALGVREIDKYTLEITLTHPDPMFLERLCSSGAMPCNREFFASTNGAYGLFPKTLLSNGRFTIATWVAGTAIGLKKQNAQNNEISYLRMIVPESKNVKDSTPLSRLENKDTNGELVTGSVTNTAFNHTVFSTTSWVLAFNCAIAPFNNESIRLALALSAYNSNYTESSNALEKSIGLVPPSITMLDKSYRDYAGNTLPSGDALTNFRNGMAAAKLSSLSNITVLVPNDEDFSNIFSEINQQWQKELSVFFSVNAVDRQSLISTVESGKYQIALLPIQESENDALTLLSRFSNKDNFSLFNNEEYNSLILKIQDTPHTQERAVLYVSAEQLLQQKAPIIPLFYETSTYLYSSNIKDIVISPYGPIIDITFATRG